MGIGSNGACDRARTGRCPHCRYPVEGRAYLAPRYPAPEGGLRAWTQPTDSAHRLTARVDQRIVTKVSPYRIRPAQPSRKRSLLLPEEEENSGGC